MAFKKEGLTGLKEGQHEDFSNDAIAKSLSMKNRRAAGNWKQLVKAIEIQKTEISAELIHSRKKLLGKRDEIETRTVSLSAKNSSRFQEEKPALLKVYDSLMASIDKEKRSKSGNVAESITRHTQSSERKKAIRKNISLSLNELQKRGPKKNIKFKEQIVGNVDQNTDVGDIGVEHTRPRTAFDYTEEEEEINRKLYCSPTALPRIYLQTTRRPRYRSFDKDEEYHRKVSCNEESWKDIHQCRHLRLQKRSHSMYDLRSSRVKTTI
jgi:hypothetical protein